MNPGASEEDEKISPRKATLVYTDDTADTATTTRASRKGLVKLMRGDVIRFKARSQLNTKIFFIELKLVTKVGQLLTQRTSRLYLPFL
jgi:hypothetical protein